VWTERAEAERRVSEPQGAKSPSCLRLKISRPNEESSKTVEARTQGWQVPVNAGHWG
jgi:hypothetical protein